MKNSKKVITSIFILVSTFSCSTFAVIVEGTFSGRFNHYFNVNMDATPDAEFWHEDANENLPFTGSFWYDTELGGAGISPWTPEVVMYIQEYDWIHATLVGGNGVSLDIMSRGSLPNFSEHPRDSIYIERNDWGSIYQERLSLSYGDSGPAPAHGVVNPFRSGSLVVVSTTPLLNGFGLEQEFEFPYDPTGIGPVAYFQFGTRGTINGVAYEGELKATLDHLKIQVRQPVSVPEPSSLLLFFVPLIFLLWHAGFIIHPFASHFRWKFQFNERRRTIQNGY